MRHRRCGARVCLSLWLLPLPQTSRIKRKLDSVISDPTDDSVWWDCWPLTSGDLEVWAAPPPLGPQWERLHPCPDCTGQRGLPMLASARPAARRRAGAVNMCPRACLSTGAADRCHLLLHKEAWKSIVTHFYCISPKYQSMEIWKGRRKKGDLLPHGL